MSYFSDCEILKLRAEIKRLQAQISDAPRMRITLRTDGGLDIVNIDEIQIVVGEPGVYRLVKVTTDSAKGSKR